MIIVEDGTGKVDAQSYCSVAFADAYFATRNVTAWALLTQSVKESSLVKATDYLDATYTWAGSKASSGQSLSWPRLNVVLDGFDVASNTIPVRLQNACAELAYRASAAPLTEDQGQRIVKEKVDVLETTYAEHSDPTTRYTIVGRMLAQLLANTASGGMTVVKLVRV